MDKGMWNSSEQSDKIAQRVMTERSYPKNPSNNNSNSSPKHHRASKNCSRKNEDIKQVFRNRNYEFIN